MVELKVHRETVGINAAWQINPRPGIPVLIPRPTDARIFVDYRKIESGLLKLDRSIQALRTLALLTISRVVGVLPVTMLDAGGLSL
jgi:hypothetical protein